MPRVRIAGGMLWAGYGQAGGCQATTRFPVLVGSETLLDRKRSGSPTGLSTEPAPPLQRPSLSNDPLSDVIFLNTMMLVPLSMGLIVPFIGTRMAKEW